MDRIKDKVYFITGAGSGVGKDIAETLIKKGAVVYAGARRLPRLDSGETGRFIPVTVDVTSTDQVNACVDRILKEAGHIDVLINCAGSGIAGALEDCSPEEALAQIDVNTIGALRTTRAVLPSMRKANSGVIINIGSIASLFAIPYQGLYSMSKAALRKETEALRLELKGTDIQVSVIEPGDLKTGFTAARTFSKETARSPREAACKEAVARMAHDEENGSAPACVTRMVLKLLAKEKLPAARSVGGVYVFFPFLARILPYSLVEFILGKMYMS